MSSNWFDDYFGDAWPRAFRLASFLTHDTQAGEDIAQDVLSEMSRRWDTLERPDAYLQRAVTNASWNWNRHGRTVARRLPLLGVQRGYEARFDDLADAIRGFRSGSARSSCCATTPISPKPKSRTPSGAAPAPSNRWHPTPSRHCRRRSRRENLEDDIREVLDHQANTMHVPNPHRDRPLTLTPVTTQPHPRRVWMLGTAAVLIGLLAAAVVLIERPSDKSAVNTDAGGSPFAAAIESAGMLIKPSAEETATASDKSLYETDSGSTQVSAADNFAALRTCPTPTVLKGGESSDQPCDRDWAYVTGSVDGSGVHRGVLGEADQPELFVLDDRFFVAMETSPGSQSTPTAWLIDSVSGGHEELTWRDEPTTVNSPEQALVISDGHGSVARNAHQTVFDPNCSCPASSTLVMARFGRWPYRQRVGQSSRHPERKGPDLDRDCTRRPRTRHGGSRRGPGGRVCLQ